MLENSMMGEDQASWARSVYMDVDYVLNNAYGLEYWDAVRLQMPVELATYIDAALSKLSAPES